MTATVFEHLYSMDVPPPWDMEGPAPFVVDMEAAGRFRGDVLDVGCGTGENALYLASRGLRVVGVDVAPSAIVKAADKARARGLDVQFAVADACELAGYDGAFDTVLDSGLFHSLSEPDQQRYVAALHRATRPGAVVHLRSSRASEARQGPPEARQAPTEEPALPAFYADMLEGWSEPDREEFARLLDTSVTRDQLERAFSEGWSIESLQSIETEVVPGLGECQCSLWLARIDRQ